MSESHRPILSLPVETKNRELIGKLLLAAKAVDQGWAVVLGKQSRVMDVMPHCPPAVHVEASIPAFKFEERIRPLLAVGHRLGCLCEEGIVYPDGRDYCQRKVGPEPLSRLSYYFANGQRQCDDITRWRETQALHLAVSGNPRFDLLHPPYRSIYDASVRSIKQRIGCPFILVNTNFSLINPHPAYGNRLEKMRASGRVVTPEQERIWAHRVQTKQRLAREYRQLVEALHRAGRTVVIRPHPSENQAVWKTFAAEMERVHVIHDGSANAWMLAAEVVIHSGCTTGLEAFLLDRPVIAYLPEGLRDDESFINDLALQAASLEQVLSLLQSLPCQPLEPPDPNLAKRRSLARHYIANSDRAFACDRILEMIQTDPPEPQPLAELRRRLRSRRRPLARRLASGLSRQLICALPDRLSPASLRRRKVHHHLHRQKFPGLSRAELQAALAQFRQLGVVASPAEVERIDTDLFLLTPTGG